MSELQKQDFSKWYIQTIQQADLMDYSPVRGCMIFKPDGYELWEHIQAEMNRRFQEEGIRNAYFPMLIPESFFAKEKDHIEGFSPELPFVTEAAGEILEEKLALRPTSETMIGYAFSQWINSYRDLPLEINQWANVFRWEKKTLPFLRTSEFLWQEGHTAHVDEEDARRRTMRSLVIYKEVVESLLAIPVYDGEKTPSERFAGAVSTYSIEAMMKDGKAVQAGTSHYMGTKFAEAFDIKYLDKNNQHVYAHTTSFGVSTRLIGATIMTHGDEQGLVLPPRIAPTQVVLIPVGPWKKNPAIIEKLDDIFAQLKAKGIRVKLDDSDNSPGFKFNEWELKGVPMRVECGPRDLENNQVMTKMRDAQDKVAVSLDDLVPFILQELDTMQTRLLESAKANRATHEYTHINTLDELKTHIDTKKANGEVPGWVLIGWDGTEETEAKIKEETGFTTRNIPFAPPMQKDVCLVSGKPAKHTVWIARAY
ncbi:MULTISPECIES: proline--tRNA ligase [unclassified Granulicatella]|uniref:proline--tRNA ligase n=1 Tax=unclassified Granulicatella TaxID=2630493 RepID=UPI001074222D|nr:MULTISPECIES: proline--tRNA ligase [unclassified Granulicatella]MBF0779485.1 proline--tRNA ligase [Granulicatella sp. 19428wC4_WM01]TFU96451.1 proline--tRNA ligase [Granulicatella sp. WM01]